MQHRDIDGMAGSFGLKDHVVVITGAAGGIGTALAKRFYREGARLALADFNKEGVSKLASELDATGERVISVAYNATEPSDADRLVSKCISAFGHIDHLVPAAGIFESQAIANMTDEQWRRTMAINLDGLFYICRRAIPFIADGGTIVTIASGAAHSGSPGHVHYSASKGGVLAFTKSLAKELAPKVRVNTVSPGTIDTKMIKEFMRENGASWIAKTPAGRVGTTDEVASAVLFLCSSASSYIFGQAIHVNGGSYIGG
ncbi:SDR family oxidoreductase [Mesorhizobium sp. M0955]|uniref:SDR family NAD(P)-dependent oxidoreductase n=1 Tax=Mesorhizobium sp. M0955 TaxID=2957033 RepID=UPI00333850E2